MCARSYVLITMMALALSAVAQPAVPVDPTPCASDIATLQQAMETARAKGQMLRRQQLAEELVALQARCVPGAEDQHRAAAIEQLEQEIRDLRSRLEQAQAQLRKLKGEGA